MKRFVVRTDQSVAVLFDDRLSIFDWWPNPALVNAVNIDLSESKGTWSIRDFKDIIAEFDTLEEFNKWFIEIYFAEML